MAYKLVVDCDICGKEHRVPAKQHRRSEEWVEDGETHVSAGFSLMTEKQRQAVDGNMYDSEIYFETVCQPCRVALRDALKEAIAKRKRGKR